MTATTRARATYGNGMGTKKGPLLESPPHDKNVFFGRHVPASRYVGGAVRSRERSADAAWRCLQVYASLLGLDQQQGMWHQCISASAASASICHQRSFCRPETLERNGWRSGRGSRDKPEKPRSIAGPRRPGSSFDRRRENCLGAAVGIWMAGSLWPREVWGGLGHSWGSRGGPERARESRALEARRAKKETPPPAPFWSVGCR
ncbi:hypothetical protein BJ166DRAFT_372180 [Pestalotiopsis sp. NC0098]|nr:hypothetical protein BJ166DRAFT_372180 [Pestalotiopsis sp. NC0098]